LGEWEWYYIASFNPSLWEREAGGDLEVVASPFTPLLPSPPRGERGRVRGFSGVVASPFTGDEKVLITPL